ncbi:hypothetical protein [Vibrio maritimus]|uniref:hypothetical protein n=1 Tax=Vibrio maritimus TaxID=990268 RepID=UPI001F201561|nr:hypothetical protein [Vibrio maritimus]
MKELNHDELGHVIGGAYDFGADLCKGVPKKINDNTCGARKINDRLNDSKKGTKHDGYHHGYPLSERRGTSNDRTSTGGSRGNRR